MGNLVETLETQHRLLERIVVQIEAAIEDGNAGAVGEQLKQLHGAFAAHVALENRDFYPAFELAKDVKADSRNIARLFSTNMRLIAEGLGMFLKRYLDRPIELERFEREWRPVAQTLAQRIASEEKTLHPLFERLS
jgi:hypothetical protein